jgi:hypothetical protein
VQAEWWTDPELQPEEWYMILPGPIDPPEPRKRRKLPMFVREFNLFGASELEGDDGGVVLRQFWELDIDRTLYPAAVAQGDLWKSPFKLLEWLSRFDTEEWWRVIFAD